MKKAEMKEKIKKITSDKRFKLAVIIAVAVLVLILVIRLFLLVIPVSGFEIEGETFYQTEELINAANVRLGTPIYGINKSEVKENILSACPHIEKVEIKQNLLGVLCFVVEEKTPGWYVQVYDVFYALDYDLKVIHETYDEEILKIRGITKITFPELQSVVVGELPTFGNGDELLIEETLTIIDSIRTHKIKKTMTELDLSNRFDIEFTVSETFKVMLGSVKNPEDTEKKLDKILSFIELKKQEGKYGGEINLTTQAIIFKEEFAPAESENEIE